ncbi:hypothetical protein NC653_027743 [Populus alba x Populus x berolinensis]|uniref:Uncharacterized protein n=1 Tax=Populus alba x Populus x berolinensis TaxID=444605 RepID=A0AAD6M652_9ROSI|nr:hypothetical protein NC653_027743 [Populus alba x Populus x berolinensis]
MNPDADHHLPHVKTYEQPPFLRLDDEKEKLISWKWLIDRKERGRDSEKKETAMMFKDWK